MELEAAIGANEEQYLTEHLLPPASLEADWFCCRASSGPLRADCSGSMEAASGPASIHPFRPPAGSYSGVTVNLRFMDCNVGLGNEMADHDQIPAPESAEADVLSSTNAPSEDSRDEVRDMLRQISEQIDTADRQHGELLNEMSDRIAALGDRTDQVRVGLTDQFSPAFDRLRDGLDSLSGQITAALEERMATAAPEEFSSANESEFASQEPTAAPSHSVATPECTQQEAAPQDSLPKDELGVFAILNAEPEAPQEHAEHGPWDAESAEALTRIYEDTSELGGVGNPHDPAGETPDTIAQPTADVTDDAFGQMPFCDPHTSEPEAVSHPEPSEITPPTPAVDFDRQWLDERFAMIAERIEQSAAESRPHEEFAGLGEKFDQLESSISAALDDVAARAQTSNALPPVDLSSVEENLGELAGYVEQAQSKLARLDAIEAHLESVMDRLSDDRLIQLLENGDQNAKDLERLAMLSAEAAVASLPGADANQSSLNEGQLSDLYGMLSRHIEQSREGEQHTAGVLDTLREAMLGVLDRVEQLERPVVGHNPMPGSNEVAGNEAVDAALFDDATPPGPVPEDAFVTPADQMPMAPHSPIEGSDGTMAAAGSGGFAEPPPPQQTGPVQNDQEEDAYAVPRAAQSSGEHPAHDPGQIQATQAQPQPTPPVHQQQLRGPAAEHVADPAPLNELPTMAAIEKLRQDFIEDARSAKELAARRAAEEAAAGPKKAGGLSAMLLRKRKGGSENAPQAAEPNEPKSALASSAKSLRKRLLGALVLLAIIPGAALLYSKFQPALNMEPAASTAVIEDGAAATTTRPPAAPKLRSALADTQLPPPGMAFQKPRQPLSPAAMERVERRQDLAHMSSKVADAAASAPFAALLPEYAATGPRQAAGRNADGSIAEAGAVKTLGLPPVTVGPLSLRIAAAKGDPSAEFEVGARMAEGKGPNQDFKQAARWYQRSASKGFAQSQYRLGTLFERGLGVKKDMSRARLWYERAAQSGNIKAMHNLAVLAAGRNAQSPDYTKAAQWFQQAADHGLSDSQYNLAVLFENGLGVEQNLTKSYQYTALAARSGDAEATRRRQSLKQKLSESELAKAEAWIKSWRRKPVDNLANDARVAGTAWQSRESAGYTVQ